MSRKNRNKRPRPKAQPLVKHGLKNLSSIELKNLSSILERIQALQTTQTEIDRLQARGIQAELARLPARSTILIDEYSSNVAGKPNLNDTDDSDEISAANLNRLIVTHPDKDHLNGATRSLPEPSKTAQSLFSVLFRPEEREGAIGDLTEKYRQQYQDSGKRKADLWLYFQIAQSMAPLLFRIGEKVGWLVLGEWIKRHIS